jgi:hypothetical protein
MKSNGYVFHAQLQRNTHRRGCDPDKDRNAAELPNPRGRRWDWAIGEELPGLDDARRFWCGAGWATVISIPLWLLIAWAL